MPILYNQLKRCATVCRSCPWTQECGNTAALLQNVRLMRLRCMCLS